MNKLFCALLLLAPLTAMQDHGTAPVAATSSETMPIDAPLAPEAYQEILQECVRTVSATESISLHVQSFVTSPDELPVKVIEQHIILDPTSFVMPYGAIKVLIMAGVLYAHEHARPTTSPTSTSSKSQQDILLENIDKAVRHETCCLCATGADLFFRAFKCAKPYFERTDRPVLGPYLRSEHTFCPYHQQSYKIAPLFYQIVLHECLADLGIDQEYPPVLIDSQIESVQIREKQLYLPHKLLMLPYYFFHDAPAYFARGLHYIKLKAAILEQLIQIHSLPEKQSCATCPDCAQEYTKFKPILELCMHEFAPKLASLTPGPRKCLFHTNSEHDSYALLADMEPHLYQVIVKQSTRAHGITQIPLVLACFKEAPDGHKQPMAI